MVLDGLETRDKIVVKLQQQLKKIKKQLRLDIIQIGKNDASRDYIKNKVKVGEQLGIICNVHWLRSEVKESTVLKLIENLNEDPAVNGIILQLPIPAKLDLNLLKEAIDPKKDIDGFTDTNIGSLFYGRDCLTSCTAVGIVSLLDEYKISLSGKNVTIIGRSPYIGKSLYHLLLNRDATVTMCHSKTRNINTILKRSDIIVSAVGKRNFITRDMISAGVVMIDVGINYDESGHLCGDCNFEEIYDMCSYITPVPGGVGPMTVISVFTNLIKAYKIQNKM